MHYNLICILFVFIEMVLFLQLIFMQHMLQYNSNEINKLLSNQFNRKKYVNYF